MKVSDLLAAGRTLLIDQTAGRLEAEILLCETLEVSRAWLYANPEHEIQPDQADGFLELAERRKGGEPVAYLTGRREFWSLSLKVTAGVLIPRAETELLVETALAGIPKDAHWRIVDLGSGSGAIALAIASERPLCEVHATDISEVALEVARENGRIIAPGRISFHHGFWLEPLTGRFHVIVSNPPYIAADDPHLAQGDCRFEPSAALVSGDDGLAAIRIIAREAINYLEPGGLLAFEHGFNQGGEVRKLLELLGYTGVSTRKDLENRERVTSGTRS
ncbi:MAG: peptide chain release factor N(5)-glutamine methyltransferase [Xanthomonadales bacterium]|nr:peptide chain release factor N(5)-glutamine methyltransferase [Xanthomonadales bacterium]